MKERNQKEPEEDFIVMTDTLRDQLLQSRKPEHLFDLQVPLARDENLSVDWVPVTGDFSLHFDGKGVIYQISFDGRRWQKATPTSFTKEYVQEMVHTGAWELCEYNAEVWNWYFRQK
jgi:hypothetical protein